MGTKTGIAWARSTFNPWIGCTKVGPGCDFCYAERDDKRFRTGGRTHWGLGVPRHQTSLLYWQQPHKWNEKAPESKFAGRKGFWPVFGDSWCDIFDNEVPAEWRADYWRLIKSTPNLKWLIVTKRIVNAPDMLPPDWGDGYPNVWLIISITDQREADRDIPKLLKIPAWLHGVSYEPALGPVDFRDWLEIDRHFGSDKWVRSGFKPELGWIIVGGESGSRRWFDLAWARDVIAQCKAAGVACLIKQLGANPGEGNAGLFSPDKITDDAYMLRLDDAKGAAPSEWPEEFQVQEFPR